jgi:mRNA-degrading endonuclease toxin of MazEF toxin-antitoxin module
MKRDRALIVSNDANNRAANTVTVLPLGPNVSRVYPFEVLLSPKGKCPCPNLPRLRSSRFALSPRNAYEVTR